ncbi:uncharacterized membrane protein YozB (DUF420 family) [Dysgonomonadaceae bacterium PH5-43]|nr:uncharacterized membrane protein YozB (DUF420 family) [Dysgonomonadaceae bacterium PH5-43]
MEIKSSIVIILAAVIVFIYLFTVIKIYKDTKFRNCRISPLWLIVFLLVPILGPLLFLLTSDGFRYKR